MTWAEMLRGERPAAFVLGQAQRAHPVGTVPALREVVGALPTEALLLALRMLDGFEGTLPELLATARTVVGHPESAP